MSNPFASGSNSEPIGGIQPNDGGGGRGGSAFPQTSSGKVSILGVVSARCITLEFGEIAGISLQIRGHSNVFEDFLL